MADSRSSRSMRRNERTLGLHQPAFDARDQNFLLLNVASGFEDRLQVGEESVRRFNGIREDIHRCQVILLRLPVRKRVPEAPQRRRRRRRSRHAAAEAVTQKLKKIIENRVGEDGSSLCVEQGQNKAKEVRIPHQPVLFETGQVKVFRDGTAQSGEPCAKVLTRASSWGHGSLLLARSLRQSQ